MTIQPQVAAVDGLRGNKCYYYSGVVELLEQEIHTEFAHLQVQGLTSSTYT